LGRRAEGCFLGMTLFNTDQLRFAQECVQGFGKILRMNRAISLKKQQTFGLCNGEAVCFLWGNEFLNIVCTNVSLQSSKEEEQKFIVTTTHKPLFLTKLPRGTPSYLTWKMLWKFYELHT